MKKTQAFSVTGLSIILITAPLHAAIVDVRGPVSLLGPGEVPGEPGGTAAIIPAPASVTDDAAHNTVMQGFDERQGVVLAEPLRVDTGWIPAGTRVDSHMIFLNTGPGDDRFQACHFSVLWVFSGEILGTMTDGRGQLELMSNALLGAPDTQYPTVAEVARGLESNQNGGAGPWSSDGYSYVEKNVLRLGMSVTEPGDWVRVVTRNEAPPVAMLP